MIISLITVILVVSAVISDGFRYVLPRRCMSSYSYWIDSTGVDRARSMKVQLEGSSNPSQDWAVRKFIEFGAWNSSKELVWNDRGDRLVQVTQTSRNGRNLGMLRLYHFFCNCFIPGGELSAEYYKYTTWRIFQRFISATNNVFGTQALLLALGFKKHSIGLAAATTWVIKDALGKISRIFWASRYGRKFDTDAKKWRFRSSILFAAGNGLEVFTYLFPSLFLVSAALGNALKQIAMLTSSATRNTM